MTKLKRCLMRKSYILIDGNNWGFAALAAPRLSAGGSNTSVPFIFFRQLYDLKVQNPDAIIIVLWDGKSWRKDIYPEYKANRKKDRNFEKIRSEYSEQLPLVHEMLSVLGINQVTSDNMEADDLAYFMCKQANITGDKVTLITADKDWQQLVTPNINWVDTIHDLSCNFENFSLVTGCANTKQFIEQKCILGDNSDNIKGINGIGPKTLEKIYSCYGSIMDFYVSFYAGVPMSFLFGKTVPKALTQHTITSIEGELDRNKVLMDLGTKHRPQPIIKNITAKFDKKAFEQFAYKYAFLSITRQLDKFLKPFEV